MFENLARQRQPDFDFRLPARVTLPVGDQRRVARSTAMALATERARGYVQQERIHTLARVAHTGVTWVSAMSRYAEQEAARLPEERARVDALADMFAAGVLNIIGETAA
jgi:hypothetical protein